MRTKLGRLISYYEAERTQLMASIEECVAEADFRLARLYSKGLRVVEDELQACRRLADPFYDQKASIHKRINWLETLIESTTSESARGRYVDSLREERRKLEGLNDLPVSAGCLPKSSAWHATLQQLLRRKIDRFTLVLDEGAGVYCVFQRVRLTLIVTLPQVQRLVEREVLHPKMLKQFKRLGFRLCDGKDKLLTVSPFFN